MPLRSFTGVSSPLLPISFCQFLAFCGLFFFFWPKAFCGLLIVLHGMLFYNFLYGLLTLELKFLLLHVVNGTAVDLVHFWSKWLRFYVDMFQMNLQMLDGYVWEGLFRSSSSSSFFWYLHKIFCHVTMVCHFSSSHLQNGSTIQVLFNG